MSQQNYKSEDAFARWRTTGLARHLREMRRWNRWARFFDRVAGDLQPGCREVTPFEQWYVTKFGKVTWGVFARAFWPIYDKGTGPLFYGSVIWSDAAEDEDAPSLFEVAEQVRNLRDYDIPTDAIEEFAATIRDDYAMTQRIEVPERVAMRGGYFLQSIGVPRRKLPDGYLHHRLVPIITQPTTPYATILDCRHWTEEFTAIWRSGRPALSEEELRQFREDFPEITP